MMTGLPKASPVSTEPFMRKRLFVFIEAIRIRMWKQFNSDTGRIPVTRTISLKSLPVLKGT